MALSVTHTFVSAIADDPTASAAGEVLPSHWNAAHTISGYAPITVNAQTGASYTIVAADLGKLVTLSNAGAVAVTLPQATGSFAAGTWLYIENKGAGTATITPTTSTIDGSATLALTTNQGVQLVSDGTNWASVRGIGGAGGGTPGGSATQIQYNNTGAFGGIAGSAVSTAGGVTLNNGTLTANDPVLSISQTWNNVAVAFTALKVAVTDTTAAAGSKVVDFQIGGASTFFIKPLSSTTGAGIFADGFQCNGNVGATERGVAMGYLGIADMSVGSDIAINWCSTTDPTVTPDTALSRRAAGVLSLFNSGTKTLPTGLHIFNTVDTATGAPTNYERLTVDFGITVANTATIATQKGGTGTARDLSIQAASGNINIGTGANDTTTIGSFLTTGANNGTTRIGNVGAWAISPTNNNSASADCALGRVAASVMAITNGQSIGNGGTVTGWLQWGGQARVTADVTNTTTTLATVTGLSVTVAAGRSYFFETELYITDAAAGGVQAAIAGTATATAIQYTGYTIADNAIKAKTNATALGTVVGSTLTTETAGIVVRITGTITVNAGGTLLVQFAQNTTNATATTAKRGSYLLVYDMP